MPAPFALAIRSPRPLHIPVCYGALLNQREQPIEKILQHRQTVLALSDLPGNELHYDLFLQLSFSGSNLRIPQQTLSRLGCAVIAVPRGNIGSRGSGPGNDALHETFSSRVTQNRHIESRFLGEVTCIADSTVIFAQIAGKMVPAT